MVLTAQRSTKLQQSTGGRGFATAFSSNWIIAIQAITIEFSNSKRAAQYHLPRYHHKIRNTQQSTGRGGGWAKHQQQAMAIEAIGSEGCGNRSDRQWLSAILVREEKRTRYLGTIFCNFLQFVYFYTQVASTHICSDKITVEAANIQCKHQPIRKSTMNKRNKLQIHNNQPLRGNQKVIVSSCEKIQCFGAPFFFHKSTPAHRCK